MLLPALLSLALSQGLMAPSRPTGPIVSQPNTLGAFAAFEFAPANGRGMGSPCAGTIPTGARGETLTFTRASSATCLKSASMFTGIAPGDMSTLSSNQPRVEYGTIAVNPVLGVRIESTRTNNTLRSEELDNASWASDITGGGVVTVTPDDALSPLNTTTAERIQSSATNAGQAAVRYQLQACPAGTSTLSFFVSGKSAGGTTDICITTASAVFSCVPCTFVATNFARCSMTAVVTAGFGHAFVGNATVYNGGTTRAAVDLEVWGAQCEVGPNPSSYIATTTVAVARAVDSPLRLSTLPAGLATAGSAAATLVASWSTTATGIAPYWLYRDGAGRFLYANDTVSARTYDGVNDVAVVNSIAAGTPERWASSWTGSTLTIYADTTLPGTFDTSMGSASTLDIGGGVGGNEVNGVLKLVCVDPDPARCR